MIELEDLETLGEDALEMWPEEVVGKRFIGWVVTPGGTVHESQVEAELYVEDRVSYPIQWHGPFPDRDPSPTVFGAHPKIIAHWKTTGHLQPGRSMPYHTDEERRAHDREFDEIRKEIGDIAYEQWVISTEHEPIFGLMQNAVLPHAGSRFFARDTGHGPWEVCEYSPFSKSSFFVKRVASRAEAVITAGLAHYERAAKECGMPEAKRAEKWQVIKKRAFAAAAVVGIVVGLAAILP